MRIVNDIRNFVFGLAGASVYGSCKRRKQKLVMSFTIAYTDGLPETSGQAKAPRGAR